MTLTKIPTSEQIKRLPKALIHDHLDGGLRPQTIIDLAAKINYKLPKIPLTNSLTGISILVIPDL